MTKGEKATLRKAVELYEEAAEAWCSCYSDPYGLHGECQFCSAIGKAREQVRKLLPGDKTTP